LKREPNHFFLENKQIMTMRYAACVGLALLAISTIRAGEPPGTVVEESWESATVDEARIGSVHTTVRALEVDSTKRLRAATELDFTFKRKNATTHLRMEHGTDETPEGKVLSVFMRQYQGDIQQLNLSGTLENEKMHVLVDKGHIERFLRWDPAVVGVGQREHLFEKRQPKPGDTFSFLYYEPTVNSVVTIRVRVRDREEIQLDKKQTLLRVEMKPDKIEVPGNSLQLPGCVWWLDDKFVPRRRQLEIDGIGTVILTRTTRELATQPALPGKVLDVSLTTLVPLNRTIPKPYETRSVVYRITIRGDDDAGSALVNDAHQEVANVKGNTFELHVHPVRSPTAKAGAEPGAEFLGSSYYIPSDDAAVKELARQAVGKENDPWRKALRIERWVKQNMRVDNAIPIATAAQTARDLRGDCRHYALLTTALCRAEGIPARTALGLVYVEKAGQKPALAFHMWTEVWIQGAWFGVDSTRGNGGVSAAYVKVSDHSWNDTRSLTPLLPVSRVLGKLNVEVVRVNEE
jgi:transglutaminase-like putative cysteine protease